MIWVIGLLLLAALVSNKARDLIKGIAKLVIGVFLLLGSCAMV